MKAWGPWCHFYARWWGDSEIVVLWVSIVGRTLRRERDSVLQKGRPREILPNLNRASSVSEEKGILGPMRPLTCKTKRLDSCNLYTDSIGRWYCSWSPWGEFSSFDTLLGGQEAERYSVRRYHLAWRSLQPWTQNMEPRDWISLCRWRGTKKLFASCIHLT